MSKGEATRQAVIDRALELARVVGLEGLTIGKLAEEMQLSKSGLFSHFQSKEKLQVEVISEAKRQTIEKVIAPALKKPRGEPRVRALFENWIHWAQQEGGCIFIAAAAELDDRPGIVRDSAVEAQKDWIDTLSQAAAISVKEGHFRKDLDTRQFAFELEGIMLCCHFMYRFVRDPEALNRARLAFESLVERSR